MDYIKQLDATRERNAALQAENQRLLEEISELKKQNESIEPMIAEYQELIASLKNLGIEYQLKLSQLKETLAGFKEIAEGRLIDNG